MNKLKEECGVFGVYTTENIDITQNVYYGLSALQHRGQESCGMAICDNGVFSVYKDVGLVNDVFTKDVLKQLGNGNIAIGHVRYCTTGSNDRINAQPIVVNHIKGGTAIAHNGNLVNSYELRKELELDGAIFHTTSDTEVISYIITRERIKLDSIEKAVCSAMNLIKGAYSLIVMSATKLIVARDKNGFRPLCFGRKTDGTYIVASESCALDTVGAKFIRDVEPGEVIVFEKDGVRSIREHCNKHNKTTCIFEYIYFARSDSIIDKCSVHKARLKAGECLAKEHPIDADIVIGVPDSGLDAALGYSNYSKIPYGVGFVKNRYSVRTFISAEQKERENKVKLKLNTIAEVLKDKRVILIDDSIVRGTTSSRIIKLVRDAGAKEVHMLVSAPPFLHPCYYGTDIDSKENLIAHNHSIEEMKKMLNLDSLGYLNLDSLATIIDSEIGKGYCSACFSGEYPTEIPNNTEKYKFETKLSERKGAN
ncbi:MAG: amidophosphoribosyltransferase [Eubacteriales bacterium]|nr:amidophosphoribosyltransferase [Eubacteriales bacterium]